MADRIYTLESSERERERLARQDALVRPITERLFRSAGISSGHRVLDVGCGAGHVSALAAELVGPSGTVVGIDRDASQVAGATERWAHLANVSFQAVDLDDPPPGPFDAVVGRLVLMYQSDMAASVARLAEELAPGGVAAFVEMSISAGSRPPMWPDPGPLAERLGDLIQQGFAVTATQPMAGLRLPSIMREAGLEPQPPYETGSILYEGRQAADMQAGLFRSMIPVLQGAGADLEGIAMDTLEDDLEAEQDVPRVIAAGPLLGVWARKPR